jgi:hypothetical protein
MEVWVLRRSMPVLKQVRLSLDAHSARLTGKRPHVGSNVIVAGTAIFGADRPDEVIATLKSVVDTAQAKILAKD